MQSIFSDYTVDFEQAFTSWEYKRFAGKKAIISWRFQAINPFWPNITFLYHLKTSDNLWF